MTVRPFGLGGGLLLWLCSQLPGCLPARSRSSWLAMEDSAVRFQRALYESVGRPAEVVHGLIGDATTFVVNLAFILAVALLLVTRRFRAAGHLVLADLVASTAGEWLIRAVEHLRPHPVAPVAAGGLGLGGAVRAVPADRPDGAARHGAAGGGVRVGGRDRGAAGVRRTQPARATAAAVAEALDRVGLPVRALRRAEVDARGSAPWWAETSSGERLFVKVRGAGERDADLLFRLYR